jgi:hypothetical protein
MYTPMTAAVGAYTLRVRNASGYFDIALRVSDASELELFADGDPVFDFATGGDLTLPLMLNLDAFTGLSGNGISGDDYAFSNGSVTINGSFLSRFDVGALRFSIVSNLVPDGIPVTLHLVDMTPPVVSGSAEIGFDLSAPADAVFVLDVKRGAFEGLYGADITASDYAFDAATGKLTLSADYLKGLAFGKSTLTARVGYGQELFRTLALTVNVGNSVPPSFTSGAAALALDFFRADGRDIAFTAAANNGRFIRLEGAGITPDLYRVDADGAVTLFAEWAALLPDGEHTLHVVFDNGTLILTVNVRAAAAASVAPAQKGCRSARALALPLLVVLLPRIVKKRKIY